jgi:Saxitoxin biosynthesis operon protein SxtJ
MMSDSNPYSASSGRRFALTLAAAFGVLGAISYWRGHELPPIVLAALSVVFLLAGLLIPGRLEGVERGWMAFAHAISRVTTPLFMGIVYFVVLTPMGFLRRTIGRNPLVHEPASDSYWQARASLEAEREKRSMERQF